MLKTTKKDILDSLVQQKNQQQVEITSFVTKYYQEWLDVRFVAQFKQMVSPTSTLIDDWIVMDSTYEQVKYFSTGSVKKIARVIKDKWLIFSPNCFEFVKLSHISALTVFVFKDLQSIL